MILEGFRLGFQIMALLMVLVAAGRLRAADVVLPKPSLKGSMSVEEAISSRRSIRRYAKGPLTLEQISQLLWASQGITNSEGFRASPSAGATFPIEMYLVAGDVEGLEPGVYQYDIIDHALWLARKGDIRKDLDDASLRQGMVAEAPATLIIAAIYARTMQRYGQRGIRYVHMEAGHIGQNIYLQVESLGLATCAIGAFEDRKAAKVLGLKEQEPLYIFPVGRKP